MATPKRLLIVSGSNRALFVLIEWHVYFDSVLLGEGLANQVLFLVRSVFPVVDRPVLRIMELLT
jgi:hypothetical protein